MADQDESVSSRIVLGPETDDGLRFTLRGWSVLEGNLRPDELSIAVVWEGECFDFLLNLDVAPAAVEGGWRCTSCEGDQQAVWGALEALWRDHLFDPFKLWIEQELGKAIGLTLHRVGGTTWARLTHDIDDMTGESLVVAIVPEGD